MPKVTEAHRATRRDQILDAAVERFAAQGLQTTTMADIIVASGLSAGAIYGYFDSKQELAIAAARRTILGRVSDVESAALAGPLSPVEILRGISDSFDRDRVPVGLIVQLWGEAASSAEFREVTTGAFTELGTAFGGHLASWAMAAKGLTEEEARDWAVEFLPVLLGLGQGLIVQRALLPGFDLERYLTAVERLFA